jgi:putative phosphoesterase
MTTLAIGLLSDTHIPHRLRQLPQAVLDALAGVDVILHAGDVDDPAALEPLRSIAPVHAVRGNFHFLDLSDGGAVLPTAIELELAGKHVVLTHGHEPGLRGLGLKSIRMFANQVGLLDNGWLNQHNARRLAQIYPEADVIVFGHAHRAHVEWIGEKLLVNPGAVAESGRYELPSVARLQTGPGKPTVEIIPLPMRQVKRIGGRLCLRKRTR